MLPVTKIASEILLNEFPWLDTIKEIGVPDVRVAELSHESLVVRSRGGGRCYSASHAGTV